jgi:SAM-dependent methyltransferase
VHADEQTATPIEAPASEHAVGSRPNPRPVRRFRPWSLDLYDGSRQSDGQAWARHARTRRGSRSEPSRRWVDPPAWRPGKDRVVLRLALTFAGLLLALALVVGVVAVASKPRRKRLFRSIAVPRGRVGRLVAGVIPNFHRPVYPLVAEVLEPRADDDLLEVACGAGDFLAEEASHVGRITGLDLSEVQVALARERLADRLAAGTAEIVDGDAAALPFADARFSALACIGSLEFFDQPEQAVHEMQRVLRPGGRAVLTVGWRTDDEKPSGEDAFGLWTWNEADVRRMMAEAGFSDVTISYGPWGGQEARLVRGVKAF